MISSVLDRPLVRPFLPQRHYSRADQRETLAELVERHGPLPAEVARECMLKIVEALRADVEAGLPHGRLTLADVIIDDHGGVEVQRRNNGGNDPAALLADLAGIWHYLATGQTNDRLTGIRRPRFLAARLGWGRAPASLRTIQPETPEELDAIYRRLLSNQPAERFPNLDSLAAALGAYAS